MSKSYRLILAGGIIGICILVIVQLQIPNSIRLNSSSLDCSKAVYTEDSVSAPQNSTVAVVPTTGKNIVAVFTGRWQFLRILLPYLYRDLRNNGGVIDEVWFMRIKCNNETLGNLTKFINAANSRLNQTVFSIHGGTNNVFDAPYMEMLPLISSDPLNIKFFKLDDDIVYIHPGAFETMLREENSKCLLHFFNIAGSNWRCSWLHQKLGVYNDTNPKHLTFGYNPLAECGWKAHECAELTLNTFLHHYHKGTLDKYFFHLDYIKDRRRFSINAMLLDWQSMDLVALMKAARVSKARGDDEYWFTQEYTANSERVNCVVGEALVVHFSYRPPSEYLLESTTLLLQFEDIVYKDRGKFNVSLELWLILGYR